MKLGCNESGDTTADPRGCWNVRCQLGKVCRRKTASPVVRPAGERTASSEGPPKASSYGTLPDDKDGATPPVQQGVVEALEIGLQACTMLFDQALRQHLSHGTSAIAAAMMDERRDKVAAALASLRPPAPLMEKQ